MKTLVSLPSGMVKGFYELEKRDPAIYYAGSDPEGSYVGSGGGTAHILVSAWRDSGSKLPFSEWLKSEKRMVIHSGGQSRRLPAYSAMGKSLLPLPVFRWSVGQNLDQKLLDFQESYYSGILSNAPGDYCTLVGSGDVLFISSDRFRDLPEADVLLFGIWVEDETASRHGVFFSSHDKPDELAFVRQKPDEKELRELSGEYYYLMDSGIVLLSDKMTLKLMELSGWDPKKEEFKGGQPSFYDLYSDMLTGFGSEATKRDPVLGNPEVKLVPLHEGEFYHFGSNRDLIGSTLRLQNRVIDQRLRRSREMDHHPSIFQQNSKVEYSFTEDNHHIWIENSCIPAGWELHDHHILTGIPENDLSVSLPPRICLDVIPLDVGNYCLRPYGFSDRFRGSLHANVHWLEQSLSDWLHDRHIKSSEAGIDKNEDIYRLKLFPVVSPDGMEDMLNFMLHAPEPGGGHSLRWLNSTRLSAGDLGVRTAYPLLYKQRSEFKSHVLPSLARNHHKSIFYHLDLKKTAEDFRVGNLELPEIPDEKEPIIKRINDSMFRAVATSVKEEQEHFEQKAFGILRQGMIDTLIQDKLIPRRNLLEDQILWGRSPVRLDFAGGWTDTPPYCILNGGKVVNIAVELNGQPPLQVFARPLEEFRIVLRSIDLGVKEEIHSFEQLESYATEKGAFSIPRAALVLAGFSHLFAEKQYDSLEKQLKAFGCGIELSLLAAIPKGSGLGTSSNLAATVLGTLSEFCGLQWDKHEISYRTLILEQMLTTGGGWQDQYGGVFGGLKLLESMPGIRQQPLVKWLPDALFGNPETRPMMLLYYTGVTRVAKGILGEIVRSMFLNSAEHLHILEEMQVHAQETFNSLLGNNYEGLAEKIAWSWELNQRLDSGTNPPEIQAILKKIEGLYLGAKLLGAGGGGYLFIMAMSPEAAGRIRKILNEKPLNKRARFVEFEVSRKGFEVSRS